MPDDAAELKQPPESPEHQATSPVLRGRLTAKEILKKVFGCAGPLTDDEIMQRIRDGLASGSKIQFGSALGNATLRASSAAEFLERFWADFCLLSEADRGEVASAIRSGLKQHAKSGKGGRPKGARAQNTESQIRLVAALQFLGCPNTGMMSFLYGTEQRKETRKQAFQVFLRRQRISIGQECTHMTEALAREIVRAKVTVELAEYIVKSTA